MEHLDFVDRLSDFGLSYRGNKENEERVIPLPSFLATMDNSVKIKDFKCEYIFKSDYSREPALDALIRKAIDLDEWKHSMHLDIDHENYERFREIIQEKILKRAEDIDFLLTAYFLINHEISSAEESENSNNI